MNVNDEIDKALYGRRRGGRIRVAPAEERTADGIVFDSKHEMDVYRQLKMLLAAGTISHLQLQVEFPLVINGVLIAKYFADFVFIDREQKMNVYDAKGHLTEVYKLKRKLFHALYPHLRIVEL